MSIPKAHKGGTKERRKQNNDRRNIERRSFVERRHDRRVGGRGRNLSLYKWLRSLVKLRLGVDRRKNVDRRTYNNDRRRPPESLLTKDEIADLLR